MGWFSSEDTTAEDATEDSPQVHDAVNVEDATGGTIPEADLSEEVLESVEVDADPIANHESDAYASGVGEENGMADLDIYCILVSE